MRYELTGSLVIRLVNSAAAEATNLFDKNKIKFFARAPEKNSDVSATANALYLKPKTDEVRRG